MEDFKQDILKAGSFGLIAGNGVYPLEIVREARKAGVTGIVATAFQNETRPELAGLVDSIEWMRVGQLGRMIRFLQKSGVKHAIMAGQIHPGNLFDLRPDFKALLVLGRLKQRNAESIFGAIADELQKAGITLVNATTFLEESLAKPGILAGPALDKRELADVEFGFRIAKEMSRMDIGQTVVVKKGTVLAVEAFEGTNVAIQRGGALGKSGSVVIKVSKPSQDFRFDVPVVGPITLETAREAKIRVIAVEAGRTLFLEKEKIDSIAASARISIIGCKPNE